jgi:hypothetical protein
MKSKSSQSTGFSLRNDGLAQTTYFEESVAHFAVALAVEQ